MANLPDFGAGTPWGGLKTSDPRATNYQNMEWDARKQKHYLDDPSNYVPRMDQNAAAAQSSLRRATGGAVNGWEEAAKSRMRVNQADDITRAKVNSLPARASVMELIDKTRSIANSYEQERYAAEQAARNKEIADRIAFYQGMLQLGGQIGGAAANAGDDTKQYGGNYGGHLLFELGGPDQRSRVRLPGTTSLDLDTNIANQEQNDAIAAAPYNNPWAQNQRAAQARAGRR